MIDDYNPNMPEEIFDNYHMNHEEPENDDYESSRFRHDCTACIFLGQFHEFDLYFCPVEPTVIARISDSEYYSGLTFCVSNPILSVALRRAHDLGLWYTPPPSIKEMKAVLELACEHGRIVDQGLVYISKQEIK